MVNCKKRKNMTGTVDNAVEEIKNFFHTLQTSENWFRFGVTFSTQEKYYFLSYARWQLKDKAVLQD